MVTCIGVLLYMYHQNYFVMRYFYLQPLYVFESKTTLFTIISLLYSVWYICLVVMKNDLLLL